MYCPEIASWRLTTDYRIARITGKVYDPSMAREPMPTGNVTFLFTDIEGSTKMWEANPEQMKKALARHDVLVRAAIAGNGGYVFKTVGDAFCSAFADPGNAVTAAVSAQLSLLAQTWPESTQIRVRMALNSGDAEIRDGDYFGPP